MPELRRTPLFDAHRALGARIVPFAGFEMPVQYDSALEEHHATRRAAGIFDVSHMGEVFFEGPNALERLQGLVTNDLRRCEDGQAQYTAMLFDSGGVIDDLIVYRIRADRLLVCVNAANRAKDFAWMKVHGEGPGCTVTDRGDDYAQIAVQGPRAVETVQKLTKTGLSAIGTYRFAQGSAAGAECILARTGYTGEDGFELFLAPERARSVWDALLEAGSAAGLRPCGLGARDSLRLEACYRLYGNDMDETTTPLEAGLGWIVKLDKGPFRGRDALVRQKEQGLQKRLVGLRLVDKGIARHDYAVLKDGQKVGRVTSGTLLPTVQIAAGLAYVPTALAAEGTRVEVNIRGRAAAAAVAKTPFYKRA